MGIKLHHTLHFNGTPKMKKKLCAEEDKKLQRNQNEMMRFCVRFL
jgi:hypothetical protein